MTPENTLTDFLDTLSSPRTQASYRAALEEFCTWYRQTNGAEPEFELLTPVEVRDYAAWLQTTRRLSPATINLHLAAIRSLERHLGRTLRVRGPKQVQPPVQALSPRDLGRLLAAAEGEDWISLRNTAMLNLMARAGLRVGEVTALRADDLEINQRSGWVTIRGGKGNKTRRVPLNVEVRGALTAYLKTGRSSPDALFTSKTGQPLSNRDVQRLVADLARRAGVQNVSPHTLRHTFATRAVEKGVDLATLSAMLGHSRLETTGRYLHPTAERMREAVEGI